MLKLLTSAGLAVAAVTVALTAAPGTAQAGEGCYWPYVDFMAADPGFGYYQEGDTHLGPPDKSNPRAIKYPVYTCMGGQWVRTGTLCFGEECPREEERRKIADYGYEPILE